jgi:hypothetical protein
MLSSEIKPRVCCWDRRPSRLVFLLWNRRTDQWPERWQLSCKDFHPFAGYYDVDGSSLQVGLARNGHWVVDYTTADQDGCTVLCCLSVCGVADIIDKPNAWPWLWNISLKRQISTPCWLRKCSSSSFLPGTPSMFQQAMRRGLAHSVLLGHETIFGHKGMIVYRRARERAAPVGSEEMDVKSRRVSSTHAWRWRCSRSEVSSSGEV